MGEWPVHAKPITPKEVVVHKALFIPPQVIQAFNKLIAVNFNGTSSTVKQDAVITEIKNTMIEVTREKIFASKWLDVEEIFREAGWNVKYDKPAYSENYDAFWVFTPKKQQFYA